MEQKNPLTETEDKSQPTELVADETTDNSGNLGQAQSSGGDISDPPNKDIGDTQEEGTAEQMTDATLLDTLVAFIGTKFIKATKLSKHDYNSYMLDINPDRNPIPGDEVPGYLVQYNDEHLSWSPADVFEAAYCGLKTETMNFGHALECAKQGMCVARTGWNGKDQLVRLKSYFRPLLKSPERGQGDVDHLEILTIKGELVPWVPSATDVLANDWFVVDITKEEK